MRTPPGQVTDSAVRGTRSPPGGHRPLRREPAPGPVRQPRPARTVNTYVVDGSSRVMSTMCVPPGTSLTFVRPRYTAYPAISGSPDVRFHMTWTLVALPAAAVTPGGAGGGRRPGDLVRSAGGGEEQRAAEQRHPDECRHGNTSHDPASRSSNNGGIGLYLPHVWHEWRARIKGRSRRSGAPARMAARMAARMSIRTLAAAPARFSARRPATYAGALTRRELPFLPSRFTSYGAGRCRRRSRADESGRAAGAEFGPGPRPRTRTEGAVLRPALSWWRSSPTRTNLG